MPLNSFQTSGNSPGHWRPVPPARCRLGILRFGIVGSAIARRLTGPDSPPSLQLTNILARSARQPEAVAGGLVWTDKLVVDAVVGTERAVDDVRGALLAGNSVVMLKEPAEILRLTVRKLAEAV